MNLADIPPALLRVPPQSLESESSVLGSLLLNNKTWDHVCDILVDDDFYAAEHKLVFSAIASLINSGKPADVITVYTHLQQHQQDEAVGGLHYLNSLAQYVASAGNIRRYAETVRERSLLRKLGNACDTISAITFDTGGKEVKDILDEAEKAILTIGESHNKSASDFDSMDNLVVRVLDRISDLADNPDAFSGLKTGFCDLDRLTCGMLPGDLVVLAARPSMGKTALALNIAQHVAMDQGLNVAVFSMEMGSEQLTVRLIGAIGRIDQTHLRTGKLTDDEWPRLTEAIERLRNVSLHVKETAGLSMNELRASARRLARQVGGKLDLIVVDYIQLMSVSATASKENRATAVGELSSGLKALAKEMGCPVIALSQLSRGVEARPDKRPMLSDLRESGAIEQDADTVIFIYRDEYYTKDACKEPGVAEVIIAKQRNGPTGVVRLAWVPALTKFESMASASYH